ncbi:MAG: sulfatase-like hydrolase/transferase [Actinomycetota bacterium]
MARLIRLVTIPIVVLSIGGCILTTEDSGKPGRTQTNRPNILFVLVDDQRTGTMSVVPSVVENFPVSFTKAFTTTPNCCPSRASILTGEYAHETGVTRNGYLPVWKEREAETLGPWLQESGYYTGYVGKYFNGYSSKDFAPPGWDEFYGRAYDIGDGHTKMGLVEHYGGSSGAVTEEVVTYPNEDHPDFYATRLFAEKAVSFVDRANDPQHNPEGKPFALIVATTAPNMGHDRASFEDKYVDAPLPPWPKPPSWLEARMQDKPPDVTNSKWIMNDAAWHRRIRAGQLRTLMSVNDLVTDIWERVDAHRLRSRTWGLYFSDNGRMWGEHRLRRKYFAYEESVRVPLRVAVPGEGPRDLRHLVAGIDIAPTLMALAGDEPSQGFHGRSILPLLQESEIRWRRSLMLENSSLGVYYRGLRTHRWKYVKWIRSGNQELYDLKQDPHELRNLATQHPRVTKRLRARQRQIASNR